MGLSMRIGEKNSRKSKVEGRKWAVPSLLPALRGNVKRTEDKGRRARGFTLLELMIVLTLILILASFAVPTYHVAIVRAREAVLRDDLYVMRDLIDKFTIDKQRPPATLDELVEAGYIRGGIPVDPFTGSNQTWRVDIEDVPLSPEKATSGIVDVHSGSDEESLDGAPYSSW